MGISYLGHHREFVGLVNVTVREVRPHYLGLVNERLEVIVAHVLVLRDLLLLEPREHVEESVDQLLVPEDDLLAVLVPVGPRLPLVLVCDGLEGILEPVPQGELESLHEGLHGLPDFHVLLVDVPHYHLQEVEPDQGVRGVVIHVPVFPLLARVRVHEIQLDVALVVPESDLAHVHELYVHVLADGPDLAFFYVIKFFFLLFRS